MVQRPSAMVVQSNGVSRIERTLGGKDSFNETGDLFISHIIGLVLPIIVFRKGMQIVSDMIW
jgi:hypothetical protein